MLECQSLYNQFSPYRNGWGPGRFLQPIHYIDYMNYMEVCVFPQLHKDIPLFTLIILNGNPFIIIPEGSIVWGIQGALPVLKMNDPVCIVGGRIHHMTDNLRDGPVLFIAGI